MLSPLPISKWTGEKRKSLARDPLNPSHKKASSIAAMKNRNLAGVGSWAELSLIRVLGTMESISCKVSLIISGKKILLMVLPRISVKVGEEK